MWPVSHIFYSLNSFALWFMLITIKEFLSRAEVTDSEFKLSSDNKANVNINNEFGLEF